MSFILEQQNDNDNLATSINLPLMHDSHMHRRMLKPPPLSTKALESERLNKELQELKDVYI